MIEYRRIVAEPEGPSSFSRFLDECCKVELGASERSMTLYEAWTSWQCKDRTDQMTLTAFGRALTHQGFGAKKDKRHRTRRIGLRLLTELEEIL